MGAGDRTSNLLGTSQPDTKQSVFPSARLQQFSRSNSSGQASSLKDLLQTKIDELERQVLSRVNSVEEGRQPALLRNQTAQRGRVETTLTSMHQRITDLEKGVCVCVCGGGGGARGASPGVNESVMTWIA